MQVIEIHLIIKIDSHSYGYENKFLYRSELQALTYLFNIRY